MSNYATKAVSHSYSLNLLYPSFQFYRAIRPNRALMRRMRSKMRKMRSKMRKLRRRIPRGNPHGALPYTTTSVNFIPSLAIRYQENDDIHA